jgi:hypothetical protein
MAFFAMMFDESGLTPRGFCLLWQPGLIWLHVVSDTIIGVSYYAIPVALAYFVWKRPEIDFGWMFWMFAGFILACGTTHFFDVWTLWHPDYAIQGAAKAITAAISLITAAMLWPIIPQLLQMPSRTELRDANDQLSCQIRERNEALDRLRETEERHRLLVESVAYFAIVKLDREGYMTDWSLGTSASPVTPGKRSSASTIAKTSYRRARWKSPPARVDMRPRRGMPVRMAPDSGRVLLFTQSQMR